MFKENGALRTATSKFALKNALAKPRLSHQKADILIVDASAQLWVTAWPGKGGLVSDLINTFRQFIARQLDLKQDVYIVFDRYHQDSIKGHTRIVRAIGVTRRLYLQLATELPSQKVVLMVTQNEMQLTDLILQSLQEDPIVSRQKLVVTGLNDTIQIHNGVVTELALLKTSHEEADVIMINQLLWVVATSSTTKSVKVNM
jgi:hypothetical protein